MKTFVEINKQACSNVGSGSLEHMEVTKHDFKIVKGSSGSKIRPLAACRFFNLERFSHSHKMVHYIV